MITAADTLKSILTELNASSSDIEGSAIISSDGLSMVALIDKRTDKDRMAALASAVVTQAERAAKELQRGRPQQILIKGRQGYTLMLRAGERVLLTVMFKKDAKLGFILLRCRLSAERIAATGICKPGPRIGLVYLGNKKIGGKNLD
ncbi:MAG: roadblock/LC7 domain-containing protein [Gammaproteobacteria bacterium]